MVHVANPICDIIFMNVEDEYFSAIENRDTEILIRDKKLAEQGAQLRTSVKMLLSAGVAKDVIVVNLGRSIAEIEALSS